MTRSIDGSVMEEAVAWHLRLQSAPASDWDAFVAWLEADPERSDAFDLVEASHASLAAGGFPAPQLTADNDDAPAPSRRWLWGGAIAAVLALGLVLSTKLMPGADPYTVSTGPGQQRTLALAGGGSVTLNGGTRLVLDHNDDRFAELAEGEATFTVNHDPDRPFTVVADGNRVQDAGTVFNVVNDRGNFAVEVAEGSVVFDPDARAIALGAGQTLRKAKGGEPILGRSEAGTVGGWQRKQLSYTNVPLSRVAADVSRTQGVSVSLAPGIGDLPFTGSIRISADPANTAADLAAASGLSARQTPGGWAIER